MRGDLARQRSHHLELAKQVWASCTQRGNEAEHSGLQG